MSTGRARRAACGARVIFMEEDDMADARSFVRSFAQNRALKLSAALVAVCMFAFMLGQGAAAVRATLSAQSHAVASQHVVRVSAARGVTPTHPASTSADSASGALGGHVVFTTPAHQTSSGSPHAHKKGNRHSSHVKAAGDHSHGGSSHQRDGASGDSSLGTSGNSGGQGNGQDHQTQNN